MLKGPCCVSLLSEGKKLILRKEDTFASVYVVVVVGALCVREGEGGLYLLIRISLGLMTGSP